MTGSGATDPGNVVELHLPPPPRRRSGILLFLAAIPVLAVLGTIGALVAQEWLGAFLTAYIAVLFGGWAATPWVNGRPGRLRVVADADGLTVVGGRFSRSALGVALGIAPVAVVLLVGALVSGVDVDGPVLFGLAVIGVLALVGPSQLRRWSPASLHLSRDAVSTQVPYGGDEDLGWDELRPWSDTSRPLARMVVPGGAGGRPFPEQELTSDPAVVARLVELYRAHPGLRAELHDGRAVERLRAGGLDDGRSTAL